MSTYRGLFGGLTGMMTIDPKARARGKLSIDIPIRGLVTTAKALDDQLMGPAFFDAARFPTAHFTSTSVRPSERTARISGKLTMKGVTRPVVLEARFVGAGVATGTRPVGFHATTEIRRSAFGISGGRPLMPDIVALTISVVFEKGPR